MLWMVARRWLMSSPACYHFVLAGKLGSYIEELLSARPDSSRLRCADVGANERRPSSAFLLQRPRRSIPCDLRIVKNIYKSTHS
jgi:hypothetical protein